MELLNPQVLAIWASDDGTKTGSGFRLNTQSFSKDENLLLIKILKKKFDLNCSLHKQRKHFVIYIKADSMPKFRELVMPYLQKSMLYKLN